MRPHVVSTRLFSTSVWNPLSLLKKMALKQAWLRKNQVEPGEHKVVVIVVMVVVLVAALVSVLLVIFVFVIIVLVIAVLVIAVLEIV